MARTLNRLTAKQVESLGPGRHADGGGLYLDRDQQGRSRWVFMWSRNGRRREMGLGPATKHGVSLAQARQAATKAREVLSDGRDPIETRNAAKREPEAVPTFGEVADTLVKSLAPQWRNEKHRAQWDMTLKVYAKPLSALPVDRIDTAAILELLQPLWREKPETAARLRGRIERVLDAAKAKGHRTGENPARWRGHLDHLLPKRQKLTRGHHAALPYSQLSAFLSELRIREAVAASALEFLILTAARSAEVLGATWEEVDLKAKVWTVPAARMKAGREHRVPLSAGAISVLNEMQKVAAGPNTERRFIFPGQAGSKPLSTMALAMLMRRIGAEATVHGFRSSFRDWAGEVSAFPRELAEAALAHTVGDATELAYRRGDALEKRRTLMDAWAEYLEQPQPASNVVQFGKQR